MQFTKSIEETIQKRYSCRTFSLKPLSEELIDKIKSNLSSAFGPFGSNIRFEFIDSNEFHEIGKGRIGTYGLVKNTRYFIAGIMKKENTDLTDFGYVFEKVILKMTEMNLGTIWLGRAFNQDLFSEYSQITEDEYIPAVTPVGFIAEKKSIVENAISLGISARSRKNWDRLFFENNFNTPLIKEDGNFFTIPLKMARLAPSARNQQPWRVVKIGQVFHFYTKTKPTLKMMSHFPFIDIGIAMCHFELSINSQNYTGEWTKKDPKLSTQPKAYHYISSFTVE